jgi:hypothetical protein
MNRVGVQLLDGRDGEMSTSDSGQTLYPASQAETCRHFCTGK